MYPSAVVEIVSILRAFRNTIRGLSILSIPFAHLATWASDVRLDIINMSMESAPNYHELEFFDIRVFSKPK